MKSFVELTMPKNNLFIRTIDTPMPELDVMRICINFPSAFLFQNDKKCQISKLWFDVEHRYSNIQSEISFDKFKGLESEDEVAQSVTVISENHDIYSFVKRAGEDEIDIISKIKIGLKEEIVKIGTMKVEKIDQQ